MADKAAARARFCFKRVKPYCFPNALLDNGFNYAVPRVAGPRVDRTVNVLAQSQNIPDSTSANAPIVTGPHVDRTVDELSHSGNMPYSTYLTFTRVAVPRVDRAVGELFHGSERGRGFPEFPGLPEFSGLGPHVKVVKGFSLCGRNPLADCLAARGFRQKTKRFVTNTHKMVPPVRSRAFDISR